ncbi:adhesion G protein-coupled receptor E1 [Tamandua tetradactyla]|uniref:adhesion G protein-coupled receptor E1 n=1 Tax=Tamandua tetradactyla TaxID=48850 RepID=UPI00405477DC
MWGFCLMLVWGCCFMNSLEMLIVLTVEPTVEDVDECANSTVCPDHATCTNTLKSYFCTCKKGFLSSNGNKTFKDPGVQCKDVDECSQSPQPCGPNSECTNLPGRYKCSCLPGFSSPTGNDWISGNSGSFACSDVNECLNSSICPEHSDCANSLGSYSCVCQAGFLSRNSTCEDVDKCSQSPPPCGLNSECTNLPGRYKCSCLPGFSSPTGNGWIAGNSGSFACSDVDECVDPRACPEHASCHNTLGNFSCSCNPGFASSSGNLSFQGPGGRCEGIPFKCKEDIISNNKQAELCQGKAAMEPEHVSFCALMNTMFSILDDICKNKTITISLKEMTEHFGTVFQQIPTWSTFTKEQISTLATVLLENVESTTLAALLKPSANTSQTIETEYLGIESKVIREECIEENISFSLKTKGNIMKVGCSTIEESGNTGTTGVALVSLVGMESILNESFFQEPQAVMSNSKRKLKMNSRIVRGIMTGEKKDGYSDPVIYTLENIQPKQKFESPICVAWNTDVDGGSWTSSGCVILEASQTHTVCSCKQLVSLAIIMASTELTMEYSLHVISHVGLTISLVCLALAIATFLLCRSIRNHITDLHLQLCVCLFLAKILFITSVDKTSNQLGCAIIAGFLHYLFLACFFWMLVEAVMLFLMVRNLKVVNYFSSRNIRMLPLCTFAYGLPALVVVVSASVQPQGYGMPNRCWLNTGTGFIWSFLGPVCIIIMINSILLIWTLLILRQKLSSAKSEASTLKDTRLLTFKAFAQLFVLGCSWVLGIFQTGAAASVMAHLFTAINSLQGAFLFLIHCLLSRQVRQEYRKWFTRTTKSSSQSQTSGVLVSSLLSTSKTYIINERNQADAITGIKDHPVKKNKSPFLHSSV